MDDYDSNYPLAYYTVGEKYFFYRNTTNRNYWLPQNKVEQDIYNTYVLKYLNLFSISASEQITTGITEIITSSPGITEIVSVSNTKGVTEDKGQKASKSSNNTKIELDREGALVNFPGINKEIGVVIGTYNGPECKLLTVLFDDGKVVDYILGVPTLFSQKNYKVYSPKLKVDVPPLDKKHMPLSIQEMAKADGGLLGISAKGLGSSEASAKRVKL